MILMEENKEREVYEIPIKGSLGLLSVGYKGIMLWRMKRMGIEEEELKIIPPIVLGKVLKMSMPQKETTPKET